MERRQRGTGFGSVIETTAEYDRWVAEALPELLDRSTGQVKRFLRDTGQWADDLAHEKLALRWGYELVDRFLVRARAELPCRPFFLLDSVVAQYFSQPESLCYHRELLSPLGRFLEGLLSRAVISRDALMTLFYHLYGLGPGRVASLLALGPAESQRVYKNFERWRTTGWQRAMGEIGFTDKELAELEARLARGAGGMQAELARLLPVAQEHYRKSEPEHYPCLTRQAWTDRYAEGSGYDYCSWHLAFCGRCFEEVCDLRRIDTQGPAEPSAELRIRPLKRGGVVGLFTNRLGGNHDTGRRALPKRLS